MPDWRIWFGLALTAAWLLIGAIYVEQSIGWSHIAEQPADVIGSFLEGAFAPLAFLWLVIGYFLQHKALTQNTEALQMQFQEIQRSAEQAVRRTETIAASERHARQETFMRIADQVKRQLGGISGLLFISSQGSAGNGRVGDDAMARYWSELNRGDTEVFSRLMLTTHLDVDDEDEPLALFYGTEIRARHSNNFIFTFERLRQRAREADSEGMLEDAITGSAHGFLYRLAVNYRQRAAVELANIEVPGRDSRAAQPLTSVRGVAPEVSPPGDGVPG